MIVVFEKGFALRHIGHLDLMRTIQRALRRSNLPIRYSNGFNPHIQLSFAAPLSVGVVGLRELMDVPVEDSCRPEQFVRAMNEALPSCLRVLQARAVPDDFPTLMAMVAGSRIRVEIEAGEPADRVAKALETFINVKECVTLRKTKSGENRTNIRPFVLDASVRPTADGYTVRCTIRNRSDGSLKPSVLMTALCELAGVDAVPYIAYREAILTSNREGQLIPLEEYENA